MSTSHIILSSLPSFCQKLSKSVEIWQSSDKKIFTVFLRHWVHQYPLIFQMELDKDGWEYIQYIPGTYNNWTCLGVRVPEHWTIQRIGTFCSYDNGRTPSPPLRGSATVLKVGDKFCEQKFFDPYFLASGGQNIA